MKAETKFRWAIVVLLAVTIFAGVMTAAHAQTTCAVGSQICTVGGSTTCFCGSKTSGESPLSTTLTWNVVGANACTASGAGTVAAWTGSVPTSGTRNLSGVTTKMTLKLDCTAPATGGKMRLTWTPPTQNTDGSALTNLAGHIISYGTAAGSLNQTRSVPLSVATNEYTIDGLTAGTWFASLQAAAGDCFPTALVTCHVSLPTGTVSAPVTTTPGGALPQLSVALEPFTVPKTPTNLTATDAVAFDIRPGSDGKLLAQRVGVVRPGTLCAAEDQRTIDGVTYSRVDRSTVDVVNWSNGADQWIPVVFAKCDTRVDL